MTNGYDKLLETLRVLGIGYTEIREDLPHVSLKIIEVRGTRFYFHNNGTYEFSEKKE